MESSNNNKLRGSSNEKQTSSSCTQCQDWVVLALSNLSSRPQQLLNAMGGRVVRDETTGNFFVSLLKEIQPLRTNRSSLNKIDNNATSGANSSVVLAHQSSSHDVVLDTASARRVVASSVEQEHLVPAVAFSNTATTNFKLHSDIGNNAMKKSEETGIEISCTTCSNDGPEGAARAYVTTCPIRIVLCANRLNSKEEIEEVLVHELIHAYDYRVRKMDLRDCMQLAYSEVRAAREAECMKSASIFKRMCVVDRATAATKNMFPAKGKECVSQVLEKALIDQSPFISSTPRYRNNHTSQENYEQSDSNR